MVSASFSTFPSSLNMGTTMLRKGLNISNPLRHCFQYISRRKYQQTLQAVPKIFVSFDLSPSAHHHATPEARKRLQFGWLALKYALGDLQRPIVVAAHRIALNKRGPLIR